MYCQALVRTPKKRRSHCLMLLVKLIIGACVLSDVGKSRKRRNHCLMLPLVKLITGIYVFFQTSSRKAKEEKESLFNGSQAGSVALSSSLSLVSSEDLLTRIHKRQEFSTTKASTVAAVDAADDARGSSVDPKDAELMEDIRNFIAFMSDVNGEASTQELLTNFGPRLPPNDSAKFKAMLLQICDFVKVNRVGKWILKQEFR